MTLLRLRPLAQRLRQLANFLGEPRNAGRNTTGSVLTYVAAISVWKVCKSMIRSPYRLRKVTQTVDEPVYDRCITKLFLGRTKKLSG